MASQLQQMSDQLPQRRGLHLKEITTEGTTDSLGGILRAARLRRGEDLKAASRSTKIRTEYLDALEEGKIDQLPGRTYAIGFLRTYAEFLGLDPAECVTKFKTENAAVAAANEPALGFEEKEQGSGLQVSHSVLVLIGVVVIGLIYGGVYLFRSANDTMDRRAKAAATSTTVTGVHKAPVLGPAATQPGATDGAATTTPAPADTTDATNTTTPAKPTDGADATSSDEEGATEAPTPTTAAPSTTKTPPATTAVGAPTPTAATAQEAAGFDAAIAAAPHSFGVASAPGRLLLRANERVFVRIATQGTRQQVVYQGVLAKGDVFFVPAMDDLVLVTRNGGALDVYVDKALKGPVGPKGVALSGLALNPASFQH